VERPIRSAAARPFPRLYLDEDLTDDLGELLRAEGFDAIHTRDASRKGAIDPRQLAFAVEEHRVVVTANLVHFRMLHEAWLNWAPLQNPDQPRPHPGILAVPNPNVMPAGVMARVIADLAGDDHSKGVENRLLQWRIGLGLRDLSSIR